MMLKSASHAAVQERLFRRGELSLGLTLPLLKTPEEFVDYPQQISLASQADALGFRALWVRDVPLNNADYPDPVSHLDPWVFLGALAANTRQILLVSGAIVITLRHPLHVAKGALSVSALSGGRFILGIGSGDRHEEYAAFGKHVDDRRALYSQGWKAVSDIVGAPGDTRVDLPVADDAGFYMLPRLRAPIPLLAVGSGGQSVDWIARNSIGWMTYHREPDVQRGRYQMWSDAIQRAAPPAYRGFGVAMKLLLSENPDQPAVAVSLGYETGRHGLLSILRGLRDSGTNHVSFNLADSAREPQAVIEELAEYVLPEFHRDSPAS